jgi:hypothetical protein
MMEEVLEMSQGGAFRFTFYFLDLLYVDSPLQKRKVQYIERLCTRFPIGWLLNVGLQRDILLEARVKSNFNGTTYKIAL